MTATERARCLSEQAQHGAREAARRHYQRVADRRRMARELRNHAWPLHNMAMVASCMDPGGFWDSPLGVATVQRLAWCFEIIEMLEALDT